MYKSFLEAEQDHNFSKGKVMIHLPASEIEQLEWKEITKADLPEMESHVDFIPARMYPKGMWHEAGELGHDLQWRYFTNED